MNNLCAILHHLFARIFDVATGTTIARCKTNQLNFGVFVYTESTFLIPHRSKAFSSRTAAIAIADNYSNLCF
jgi:hypothetical protein